MEEAKEVVEIINEEKTPTQHRVERAERQTEERIFNELGVTSLEEIKAKLEKATATEKLLEETHTELERSSRSKRLVDMLKTEDAFDPDVLLPFVDVDLLKSDEDFTNVVNKLKELKPNHFGVKSIGGDNHVTTTTVEVDPIRAKQLMGDHVGALAEKIRRDRKKG